MGIPSGLITIAGGKLTGYRKMADTVVDLVAKRIQESGGKAYGASVTKNLPISGGQVGGSSQFPDFVRKQTEIGAAQIDRKLAEHWARMYGSNAAELFRLAKEGSDQAEASALPVSVLVPLMYAIRHEMASKPADFYPSHGISLVSYRLDEKMEGARDPLYGYRTGLERAAENRVHQGTG